MKKNVQKPFYTLDVFTNQRFKGNPLAVVGDAEGLTSEQMQSIAREFNLSETLFLLPPIERDSLAHLRIFTPRRELSFAGHPIVGASHVIAKMMDISDGGSVHLTCQTGRVNVCFSQTKQGLIAELSVPKTPQFIAELDTDLITQHMGLAAREGGYYKSSPDKNSPEFAIFDVNQENIAQAVAPSDGLAGFPFALIYLVHIDETQNKAEVRAFAPRDGIPEDPATGSAAVTLAAYLARSFPEREAEQRWQISQGAQMGRHSQIYIRFRQKEGKVLFCYLSGYSVQVSEGVLNV